MISEAAHGKVTMRHTEIEFGGDSEDEFEGQAALQVSHSHKRSVLCPLTLRSITSMSAESRTMIWDSSTTISRTNPHQPRGTLRCMVRPLPAFAISLRTRSKNTGNRQNRSTTLTSSLRKTRRHAVYWASQDQTCRAWMVLSAT
jgi:hypothetical protein